MAEEHEEDENGVSCDQDKDALQEWKNDADEDGTVDKADALPLG